MTEPSKSAPLLLDAARKAAAHAYAPYSSFPVGAALLFDDGSVVTGCNVENASYGLTSCAERNALFRAVSEQGPGRKIVGIAVVNSAGQPIPPCGACRQVLAEFAAPDCSIYLGGETRAFTDLLPFQFQLDPS